MKLQLVQRCTAISYLDNAVETCCSALQIGLKYKSTRYYNASQHSASDFGGSGLFLFLCPVRDKILVANIIESGSCRQVHNGLLATVSSLTGRIHFSFFYQHPVPNGTVVECSCHNIPLPPLAEQVCLPLIRKFITHRRECNVKRNRKAG